MRLPIGDITSRYDEVGNGPPVIILHGWGGTIESVKPIVQCLSHDYTTFAVDLPGFGESAQPPTTWGVLDYANWVAGFMDSVGCPRAHILGHSFGGRIGIALAAHFPALVDRLILVDSAGIRPRRTPVTQLRVYSFKGLRSLILLIPFPSWKKGAVRRLGAIFGSADYRNANALRDIFVRVVNEDLRPVLPAIQALTLLVWGENDEDVPVAHGKLMAQEIPHARLEILAGAGHFSYMDRLPQFCRIVRDFLKEKVN